MADYISALNGEQMDSALMDVALRNPEAWAVGQRNGVPVTSADETYHNNAKYYAQVAKSAIPGTYTAAVRWDIAQGLAGEAQEQARANISAGASNRNLLDNPWFRIDQRSVSGTITSGYIADRWTISYGNGGVQASRTEDTITVKSTSGSSHGDIAQRMEKSLFDFLVGKIVTASVMRSDGSVISRSFTFQSAASSIDVGKDLDGKIISVRVYQTSTYQNVQFWKWNTAATIRAVKLELGAYSTLANDVPPDYKTELDKCQYYCRVIQGTSFIAVGQAVASTVIRFPLPYVMRTRPTATLTGTAQVYGQGGPLTPSALSCTGNTTQGIEISATVSGATSGQSYMLVFSGANDKIVISADL